MKLLAHRGFWKQTKEKNTIKAFKRSLELGFGIETDVRDLNGKLVISHDMPTEDSLEFGAFLELCSPYNAPLALNIKSDGLSSILSDYLDTYGGNYFCFDMSIPDTLGYVKSNLDWYLRLSDIEKDRYLLNEAKGVWLDNFYTAELNTSIMDEVLGEGKGIALVSPELHKFEHTHYWDTLSKYLSSRVTNSCNILLCTDFPTKAQEFFNGK